MAVMLSVRAGDDVVKSPDPHPCHGIAGGNGEMFRVKFESGADKDLMGGLGKDQREREQKDRCDKTY